MTELEQWRESNARQLGAELAALRQRLDRSSSSSEVAPPVAADSAELPSALTMLCERLCLSPFERNILLLCAAMELDTRIAGLCARAQNDPQNNFPRSRSRWRLFDEPSWDALSPERPLRFWRLIEISQPGAQPLTASALRADERIVNYVKGLNHLDDRLTFLSPLETDAAAVGDLAPSQQKLVQTHLRAGSSSRRPVWLPVVQIGRRRFAEQTTRRLSRRGGIESPAVPIAGRVFAGTAHWI